MVTAALSDALSHPIQVVRDLQSQHGLSSAPFLPVVRKHFHDQFGNGNLQKVPPLDVHHPASSYPSGSLVRFRAMVQDTSASPEIYLRHLGYGLDSLPQTNGSTQDTFRMHTLQDALDSAARGADKWRERTVFWAVSVPGESDWVGKSLDGNHPVSAETPTPPSSSMAHKFPLPNTAHVGALVKSYGTAQFKPAVVHDLVGILTFDPRLNLLGDEEDDILVPTVHVLFQNHVPTTLVKAAYPMPPARSRSSLEVKDEIVRWLAEGALGGDLLAAEYVLMCCIARVQSRNPFLPPPSLLLSRFQSRSENSASTLQQRLEMLFPIVANLPLSIKYLNEVPFAPSSSLRDDSEELRSGVLQLAPGTVVVVDERNIAEGKLGEQGVRNIATMQAVITGQTLGYAFPFSSYEFPTDLSFIILASGSKSPFFNTDINVPLQGAASSPSPSQLSEDQLLEYRLWLAGAKSQAASKNAVPITAGMAEYIQSEFVRERKEAGDQSLTSDDLSLRMTLAKLETYLRHDAEITKEAWEHVVLLEKKRKTRLSSL
ncbi:hypothetical protein CALCODRAFT_555422 [Calocera cornea HHB12733]|uniref:Mini-chromosome maintenance replisome factor-domain-containing protein n=1 Tax=Calocera cornea HHB12733 TaxID=1353952 RepID=A0A165FXQ9_9BASI|nr:hypothetical protein CALCODRAFT_555422 [Calocera cornea HHB12733]